ncbi:White collar 1-like protein [Cladobotryum mycophilum]|uniref:White collar 1-like protein n=1 Tax=Cladobotryum mycophilum TaxID=491253 RepID=A0ABR0STR2_9HYPO
MVSPSQMSINSWELRALQYGFPAQPATNPDSEDASTVAWRQLQDPIIYPGIYSATGYDVMSILLRVMSRPNPKIELGAVDCSVAIVLCDLSLPDSPIVYASDSFCEEEIQCPVTNFKKSGQRFTNHLSIIPLEKEASGHHFAVGFQVQVD